ncbi:MAG TPA: rhodanese-like domain-containing protein [Gammaproteobacteria bacterium]|nr:rhodanese-like domain-containing protein [Gammaproteobacteria bacterium]
MLFLNLFGSRLKGYQPVDPAEAVNLINHDNALVLDVREANEYQSGHILNARHIPQSALAKRLDELEKERNRPIILVCRSGSRSGHVAGMLKKHGFEKVYNLSGGIMAWQNANLPLTRK